MNQTTSKSQFACNVVKIIGTNELLTLITSGRIRNCCMHIVNTCKHILV